MTREIMNNLNTDRVNVVIIQNPKDGPVKKPEFCGVSLFEVERGFIAVKDGKSVFIEPHWVYTVEPVNHTPPRPSC